MNKDLHIKREIIRISGRLKEIVTVKDSKGNILQNMIQPLMFEFYPRDIIQVIVGSSLLAVPVALTEEAWNLGESLPMKNIYMMLFLSVFFISIFVYYNYYRGEFRNHWREFLKRIIATYLFSLIVVALILTIIERAPWQTDWILALKRSIVVSFPASMSATIADIIK